MAATTTETAKSQSTRRFKQAMAQSIATRWDDVWKVLPKAIAGDDPEAIHDARVASRRLRAAMDGAAGVFPKPWYGRLHKSAKRITRSLGQVRDQDVLLAMLVASREAADPAERPGVALLIERVGSERGEARSALKDALPRSRLRRLRKESRRRFPVGKKDRRPSAGDGPAALSEPAREQIDERVADLLRFDAIIPVVDDAEELHDARIAVKRLRYSLELFEDALGEDGTRLITDLKGLQEALGDLHDRDVNLLLVGAELNHHQGGGTDAQPHLAASLEAILHRDQNVRGMLHDAVVARWRDLMGSGFRDRLERLTDSPSPPPA